MLPTYCTREAVKTALDYAETARNDARVDAAVAAGSGAVDTLCRRLPGFLAPTVATRAFDWPDLASPGLRLWFEEQTLVSLTSATTGGQAMSTTDLILRPYSGPPYTALEVNRATTAGFGLGSTPQRDILLTGVWGWDLNTAAAGTLAAALSDTTGTTVDVSDGSLVGVGDLLTTTAGERVLVTGRRFVATSVTLGGAGLTASQAGQTVTLGGTGTVAPGEVLLVDSERLLVLDVVGSVATVRRAWDGSTLAAHTAGATIAASRRLTVERGALGTAAATASSGTALVRHVYPADVVELATAEAIVSLLGLAAGMAKSSGVAPAVQNVAGAGIDTLRTRVFDRFGRKFRSGAV